MNFVVFAFLQRRDCLLSNSQANQIFMSGSFLSRFGNFFFSFLWTLEMHISSISCVVLFGFTLFFQHLFFCQKRQKRQKNEASNREDLFEHFAPGNIVIGPYSSNFLFKKKGFWCSETLRIYILFLLYVCWCLIKGCTIFP